MKRVIKTKRKYTSRKAIHYQLHDKIRTLSHLNPKVFKEAVLVNLHKLA